MEIKIIKEDGLNEALLGMKFSFQTEEKIENINLNIKEKYLETAKKLSKKDGGHNKYIESIQVWMIVRAPLYWWKQSDTYRVGITKLSKSTMHTLLKRKLVSDDFEGGLDNRTIEILNDFIEDKNFKEVNKRLPQSFLQTRMVSVNYKTLRNMILQRRGHKLEEWDYFISEVLSNLKTPELLGLE